MENKGSKLIYGSILRFGALAAMVVASFFITPFIIKHIGSKMFGFWSLAASIMGASGLLDLGLSTALKRYLPKYYAEGSLKKVNEVVCSTAFSFSIIGGVCMLSVVLLVEPLHIWVGTEVAFRIFKAVFIVLGIDAALQFPMRTLFGYFESHLRYGLISSVDIVRTLSRAALIYYFLLNNYGIVSLAIITLCVNFFSYIILIAFYLIRHGDVQFRRENVHVDTIKKLFNYSYKNVVSALANLMRYNVDNFIIAKFLGVSAVTPYVIGSSIANYFVESVSAFMGQTVPVFSYIDAEDNTKILKQVYFLLLKISTILSVYMGGMLIIMGKPFILRWMGKGFETSYTVLVILTVGLTFALSQFPTYNLLRGVSKHFIVMVCSLGEGIGNILLSVALVSKYGIVGIAFGTMVPMVLSMMFVMPFLMCRHIYYFKLFEFYFQVLGPAFLKAAFLMLCIYFLAKPFLLPEYLRLFFIGVASLLYFPIIYFLGFSKYEKSKFLMPRTRMLKLLSRRFIA